MMMMICYWLKIFMMIVFGVFIADDNSILMYHTTIIHFYRATHYSASVVLRSHVVYLSVCSSVTLVDQDHIG